MNEYGNNTVYRSRDVHSINIQLSDTWLVMLNVQFKKIETKSLVSKCPTQTPSVTAVYWISNWK